MTATHKANTKTRAGKQRLSDDRRRMLLSTRILPSTKAYLDSLDNGTTGRAIDMLVRVMQHAGVQSAIEQGQPLQIVNI